MLIHLENCIQISVNQGDIITVIIQHTDFGCNQHYEFSISLSYMSSVGMYSVEGHSSADQNECYHNLNDDLIENQTIQWITNWWCNIILNQDNFRYKNHDVMSS